MKAFLYATLAALVLAVPLILRKHKPLHASMVHREDTGAWEEAIRYDIEDFLS